MPMAREQAVFDAMNRIANRGRRLRLDQLTRAPMGAGQCGIERIALPCNVVAASGSDLIPLAAGIQIGVHPAGGFQLRQCRINRTGARRLQPFEERGDLPHQLIAMARTLGDERQQQQAQIAVFQRAGARAGTAGAGRRCIEIGRWADGRALFHSIYRSMEKRYIEICRYTSARASGG
ncbi:hypothetical protein XAUC_18450 [Xanthomonas citri pv. aurantifolii str. ICPB 10535]|nr:hypothetical protein XAUC_18450 [Xanthomonas citri pv. aurantifolii str. ICPB 10535]